MKLEDTVVEVNIGVLVFGNAIFWIIVAAFEDKFLKSDFFCNNFFDTYYLKNVKDFEISKQMKNSIKINEDGFAEILNDKAYLFKWGVTTPLILFLMFWPDIHLLGKQSYVCILPFYFNDNSSNLYGSNYDYKVCFY